MEDALEPSVHKSLNAEPGKLFLKDKIIYKTLFSVYLLTQWLYTVAVHQIFIQLEKLKMNADWLVCVFAHFAFCYSTQVG